MVLISRNPLERCTALQITVHIHTAATASRSSVNARAGPCQPHDKVSHELSAIAFRSS